MLISYPILPANLQTADEDAKLNYMLGRVRPDEGIYPVSFHNRWHGGIHLDPGSDNEPIRAIADGEIVAYRVAASPETYPAGSQDTFDTSFVLIKHTTQSGEDTPVVFYSLYMHLRSRAQLSAAHQAQLPPCLRNAPAGADAVRPPANTRIWRKDVLGFAGTLYGRRQVHFEIFATDADFKGTPASGNISAQAGFWRDRLVVPQGQHGTRDVFGDTHFVIPVNRNFVERHPRAIAPHRIDLPGANNFYDLTLGQAGSNTTDALHVVVQLSQGRRIATTYRILADGNREPLGTPVQQDDYEYELFRLATALYPDCPSAGFEYLRFGRILGPDSTTRNENWQLVRYTNTAVGYIDLAAAVNNVSVWSDADFPLNWQLLDEGQTANAADGVCDVDTLLQLIGQVPDTNQDGVVDERDFGIYASRAEIAQKLRFLICKHPSEWDSGDLANRYQREREAGGPLNDTQAWQEFEAHVNRMAFWAQAGMGDRSVWHFHPLQFIGHYRKCGWLSSDELAVTLPRHQFYTQMGVRSVALNVGPDGTISFTTALQRIGPYASALNQTMRKYGMTTPQRQAHFLCQVILETGQWRNMPPNRLLMHEWFFGRYDQNNPATQYYSAFYGRGIMQLTWIGNYQNYGIYRAFRQHIGPYNERLTPAIPRITTTSTHYTAKPSDGGQQITWAPRYDPDIIATSSYNACDSGGFFWVSKHHSGKININRVCDTPFTTESVGRVNKLVNGGRNGYYERQAYAAYLIRLLTDDIRLTQETQITTPESPIIVNFLKPII